MPGEIDRAHSRRSLEFEVEYSVLSGFDKLLLIQARTLDFSESGAKIETSEELAQGDMLSVRIELPDLNAFWIEENGHKQFQKTVIMCFGTVRWTSQLGEGVFGAGIRFSGMASTDRAYLRRLLQEDTLQIKK